MVLYYFVEPHVSFTPRCVLKAAFLKIGQGRSAKKKKKETKLRSKLEEAYASERRKKGEGENISRAAVSTSGLADRPSTIIRKMYMWFPGAETAVFLCNV